VTQGDFLKALGIDDRARALAKAAPERGDSIAADRNRLVGDDQMGSLFKVIALTAPGWPVPAGFA
jgi:SAM-dependent MidA family methyltransferase